MINHGTSSGDSAQRGNYCVRLVKARILALLSVISRFLVYFRSSLIT